MVQRILRIITETKAPTATIIIRLMVGLVFFFEGIQKFTDYERVGGGRFTRIGIPNPDFMAHFVGLTEIVFGLLVVLGLFTRVAVIPLLIIMAVALYTTKIDILQNEGFLWAAHSSRNDFCMVMGSLFLLLVGSGKLALEKYLIKYVGR